MINHVYDLLDHVRKTDSDYNDGLDGWLSYSVEVDQDTYNDILTVEFHDSLTGEVVRGRWKLVRIL